MVKQGSFFQRLKERWGSGSGVRVDTRGGLDPRTAAGFGSPPKPKPVEKPAATGGNGAGAQSTQKPAEKPVVVPPPQPTPPPVQRVEAERQPANGRELATEFAPADVRSTRKLSEREEALLAVGTHFQELTTLLRGSQTRMDDQLTKLVMAASSLTTLPALSQQQLEILQKLSTHMERQNALGEQLATTMTVLPSLLKNVEGALARAAATDERTASTVREFQATMDRIHGSMSKMVEHSDTQAKAAQQLAARRDDALQEITKGIEGSQQRAVKELQRTTDESLQALRRTSEDQSNRLQKVVMENATWSRAMLVGIGLVVVGLGALIVLQLVK
jgi:hypothetical protein